jgi:hypothetical protein
MTTDHDLDRQLDAFLRRGPSDLPDPSFDAVRDLIDHTGQRVVIGPWRIADTMNKFITLGLGAAAVVVALVVGAQFLAPAAGGVGGAPTPIGGTVEYVTDGARTTTEVDAVADGASVTGTAVTSRVGAHTVQLECAARNGDYWAVAGTVEESTIEGGSAGDWSAVIVKDGAPQRIGIWFSDPKVEGVDCDGWLAAIDLTEIGAENFVAVTSGELVPPPDLAP